MRALAHRPGAIPSGEARERRPVGGRMRVGLGVFFASVAVNAGLGIYAVLAPEFGETQAKILGTSLCVTGAVLLALACEPAWERRLLGPVPYIGAALGALGFGLAIVAIWIEPESDRFGKTMGSVMIMAVAGAAASLLALAQLAPRHRRLLRLTLGLLALGATLMAITPWLGDDPTEWFVRAMGVELITLAAFAVSVPVLHWVDRGTIAAAEAVGAIRHCPYCGGAVTGEVGAVVLCRRCERQFTVVPP